MGEMEMVSINTSLSLNVILSKVFEMLKITSDFKY